MNAFLIITHDPGVERTSYVARQFIVSPTDDTICFVSPLPYPAYSTLRNPYQPYPGLPFLPFLNHTLSYPTLAQPIPCTTFTTPTHIVLCSALPYILYTNHIYLPYPTLPYPTLPYPTYPTFSTSNIIIPLHLPRIPYPFSFLHILYIIYPTLLYTYHTLPNLYIQLYPTYTNPNTNTYLTPL